MVGAGTICLCVLLASVPNANPHLLRPERQLGQGGGVRCCGSSQTAGRVLKRSKTLPAGGQISKMFPGLRAAGYGAATLNTTPPTPCPPEDVVP